MNILNFSTKKQISEFVKSQNISGYKIHQLAIKKNIKISNKQIYSVFNAKENYTIDTLLVVLDLLNKS